jgi:hypothetical protein
VVMTQDGYSLVKMNPSNVESRSHKGPECLLLPLLVIHPYP